MTNNFSALSATVIWFNPSLEDVEHILTYNNSFEKIYIIDNSENDNSVLAKKITNSVYVPNLSNIGIASALNIGCQKAFDENYEWIMTMDQDSSWSKENLEQFLNACKNVPDSEIKSFAPVHRNQLKSLVGDLKYKFEKSSEELFILRKKVMTSGNLINLKAWKMVGGFNEDLFIDEVDHEFCYKLIHNDFKICEFQNIYMIHTLGHVKRTILPRPCKHSGVRLYYIFRNMLYIKKHFPFEFKEEQYEKYMIVSVIQKFLEFKFSDLKYIRKSIKDFKHERFGKYDPNN